jgi:ABC-type sugar transport system permease subunit
VSSHLRSYAAAATVAALVATAAFVSYRNASFAERESQRARAAAIAVAEGRAPLPEVVVAGLVLPAERSERYPFLQVRRLADGRTLGGPGAAPTDKLLYDAAGRAEAIGAFTRALPDDSGQVVAAVPTTHGIAVAVTLPPSGPEGFPWLVVIGLLAMGALVAAVGALVGGLARPVGLALGASGLAVPAYLWSGALPAGVIAASALLFAVAEQRGWLARAGAELSRQRVAYTFLTPAAAAMLILVLTPFVIGLALGFYDHHHGEWTYVGLDNFWKILSGDGRSLSDPLNFWFTLGVTVLWTFVNVALHVVIGVSLALVLRQSWLGGKPIYRMLLILPWAIPNYITALIWRGMFQSEYGAVNSILSALGLDNVSWFSSWATAFTANVTTNVWLGFPFMMVVALGALETVPRDMYEAAEVDGASAWQRFWHITAPHLRPALTPAVVLGAIWTFNMFNVIYLVSGGQPGGGTDILVTEAYRWAFERGERYGLASAYATLIFVILLLWTVLGTRVTRKETP